MIKLMIVCGTGVATSTVVTGKVESWLKEKGYDSKVRLYQSKISDEINKLDQYDIIVSTTVVPDKYKDRIINGLPFITGIGVDDVFNQIETEIKDKLL